MVVSNKLSYPLSLFYSYALSAVEREDISLDALTLLGLIGTDRVSVATSHWQPEGIDNLAQLAAKKLIKIYIINSNSIDMEITDAGRSVLGLLP